MVGSALCRKITEEGISELVFEDRENLDLTKSGAVAEWVSHVKPDVVIVAAAKVGGIHANNTYPADFIYQNLMIACNVIEAAHQSNVEKLLYLGSSCIYPRLAEQPITEEALLSGALEKTNEAYAIAKIAGVKLCQYYRQQYGRDFISAMPTNLYGPGDNYHPENSHVIPALIRKAHAAKVNDAKTMEVWGSGQVKREFMYVDDCAEALIHILKYYSDVSHINVGTGHDITIQSVAQKVAAAVGFKGELVNNTTMPDGTPRKLMSSEKLRDLNWEPSVGLTEGLERTYKWFVDNIAA